MTIGIVLPKTPGYSETFFRTKIKGLSNAGFKVYLFVGQEDVSVEGAIIRLLPRVYKRRPLRQLLAVFKSLFTLLLHTKRVRRYYQLERLEGTSFMAFIKKCYVNTPLLVAPLDWLHFGFATMALNRETVASAIGARMAVSCRGYDMDVYPLKHPGVYKSVWNYVDKVHVISEYMRQCAKKQGMHNDTPCQLITPAIDLKAIAQVQPSRTQSPLLHISTVARLHWIKGLIPTLEALALFKNVYGTFKYTIIGDGELMEPVRFAIAQLGLEQEVDMLSPMPQTEIWKHLSATDIYIQYSLSEGFCNAVLEAQASGCVCVVSDGGALPENILHEQTGLVVPKNNPQALAASLIDLVGRLGDVKTAFVDNAKQRLATDFKLIDQNRKFVNFYDRTA